MKTKILGLLMALTVALTSLPAETTAYAAENEATEVQQERSAEALGVTEAEVKASAVSLTSGVAKVDRLTQNVKERWYKFVVPNTAGYLTVQFAKQNIDEDGSWNVQVFKESNLSEVYCEWGVSSKLISEKKTYEPGTWYLRVKEGGGFPENRDYSVSVSFTADNSYEKESNDIKEMANTIIAGKAYHGRVTDEDVCDWYKYTATDRGYFTVNLAPGEQGEPGWDWHMRVYDETSKEICDIGSIHESTTSYKIPCKPGNYYVKIEEQCRGLNPKVDYVLSLAFTRASGMEGEPNNTYQQADTIKTGVTYTGALQYWNDEDLYRVKLPSDGTAYIKFKQGGNTSPDKIRDGWKVELYKGTSATPMQKLETKDAATLKVNLKKGTYYIRVASKSMVPVGQEYSLKVNYAKAPKAVKIKSVKPGKKRATISWSKSKDATGYYIYRSTKKNGKYKKIATIKKNKTVKYVDKKSLKSKKTYYYKVVAYKKTNGLTATSNMSKYKAVKIK